MEHSLEKECGCYTLSLMFLAATNVIWKIDNIKYSLKFVVFLNM